MSLDPEQLVYTNVEADRSIHGRAGFQILWNTAGVSEMDMVEVRSRFFFPAPGLREAARKRIFYRTRSGAFLIANLVPLGHTDAAGRTGLYLAHAYLFSPELFDEYDCDPITLFDNSTFLVDLDAALGADPAKRDTPGSTFHHWPTLHPSRVPGREQRLSILSETRLEDISNLMVLALQRSRDPRSPSSLGLVGPEQEIFNLISGLLVTVPKKQKPECSFDTNFKGGNLTSTPYWAVGLPSDAPVSPRMYLFDLTRSGGGTSYSVGSKSMYETMLESKFRKTGRLVGDDIISTADVARWMDSPEGPPPDINVWKTLVQKYPEPMRMKAEQGFVQKVKKLAGEQLGARLGGLEIDSIPDDADIMDALYKKLKMDLDGEWVSDKCRKLCIDHPRYAQELYAEIRNHVIKTGHQEVRMIASSLVSDVVDLELAVANARPEELVPFVNWLLDSFEIKSEVFEHDSTIHVVYAFHLVESSKDKQPYMVTALQALLGSLDFHPLEWQWVIGIAGERVRNWPRPGAISAAQNRDRIISQILEFRDSLTSNLSNPPGAVEYWGNLAVLFPAMSYADFTHQAREFLKCYPFHTTIWDERVGLTGFRYGFALNLTENSGPDKYQKLRGATCLIKALTGNVHELENPVWRSSSRDDSSGEIELEPAFRTGVHQLMFLLFERYQNSSEFSRAGLDQPHQAY